MSPRRIRKLVSSTSGQELVEAAIVIPLLLMILLGIYWFGRAFNIYGTINHAAREGARVAMTSNCASCGNTPATNAAIADAVTDALIASHLDPSQIKPLTPTPAPTACAAISGSLCSNSSNVRICTPVQINPGSAAPAVCGVTVSFQYPYQFWFPFTSMNMQKIWLEASVQANGEQ